MTDPVRQLLSRWTDPAAPVVLGRGVEGVVYEIDDRRVAKVWWSGSVDARRRVRRFLDALAESPVQLATPRVLEVAEVDGRIVTIEDRVLGTDIATLVATSRITVEESRTRVLDVLARMVDGGPVPAARRLSVLDEPGPMYGDEDEFPAALTGLVARRVARFGGVLGAAVDDLDRLVAALAEQLRSADGRRRSVVHGDLIPANIMVGDTDSPAVIDWGFLTTEGDPAFDAAIAASIFDMYSADALGNELTMYAELETRFGYARRALLVYRAAYSIITANAYDPIGADGHFAWCVAALNRADVREAVLGGR